ncbi:MULTISPECIES: S24 family peptidase [unclassified Stenotrophomonas]|uniref:S24 family peptidase n=1 Tax=unclassified Stenotrophomonas TaxID=196198 RepID=UPI0021196378|nr:MULTISPECIES: S24 family peptidase [unclassified Stenotrophomonas]
MDKYEARRAALKELVDGLGRGGIAAVAGRIGKDASYVSRMLYGPEKAGRKRIGEDVLAQLGDAFPDHFSELLVASSFSSNATPPGYVRFQLLEGAAGMGIGVVNQDYPEVMQVMEVAEWEVRRKLGFLPREGRIQIITGRGPSMRPKIEDGDIVWIDTACDYFDGDDYYLISYNGETQIKMLQKRIDGMYVVSANPEFKEWRCDVEDLKIRGKALVHAGFRRF